MPYLTFVILLFSCSVSFAQNSNDYVILSYGDTLRGKISVSPIGAYQEVRFEKDGEKTKFRPYEIKGYKVGNTRYVSMSPSNRDPRVFMEILVSGYCSLYFYSTAGAPSGIGLQPTLKRYYYLQREGEEIHEARFSRIRTGKDPYFADNPRLLNDLKRGLYREVNFNEVVERYNRERRN